LSCLEKQVADVDNNCVIIDPAMKLSDLKTSDEVLAQDLREDPAFRAEWERTALGRFLAIEVLRYRTDHGLTQRQLAEHLGMPQPQVARLERGDTNPSMDTLVRIAAGLGLELTISVTPSKRKPQLVTKTALTSKKVGHIHTDRADIFLAAA
jgi:transcriptional regulator with XRE-family HTH domain